jgi:hypothetical protein
MDGRDRGYFSAPEFIELWSLSEQAIAATTGLVKHLSQSEDPTIWNRLP